MLFRRLALIGLAALTLAACASSVDPKTLAQATVPVYSPDRTALADAPTIKGVYTRSTGLLGAPASVTYLVAIDGLYFNAREDTVANPVPPGPHAITLGAQSGQVSARVPAYLDFKPGTSYVVKFEYTGLNINTFNTNGPDLTLWVENEKTGEIVTPKLSTAIYDSKTRYAPPANAGSSIAGSTDNALFDRYAAFVQMIDGAVVSGDAPASLLEGELPQPEKPIPLAPGSHAISIRVSFALSYTYYPLILDVAPNTHYVVKYAPLKSKLKGNRQVTVMSIWIENAVTHAIVFPPVDIPFSIGRRYTPEELGTPPSQPAKPANEVLNLDRSGTTRQVTAG